MLQAYGTQACPSSSAPKLHTTHPLSAQKKSHSVGWSVSTQSFLDLRTSYIVFFSEDLHRMGPLHEVTRVNVAEWEHCVGLQVPSVMLQ